MTAPSDETLRVQIAELRGWQNVRIEDGSVWGMSPDDAAYDKPRGMAILAYEVPNYPASLDACAEFEQTLTDEQWHKYRRHLMVVIWPRDKNKRDLTARQRCESFLATCSPREESK